MSILLMPATQMLAMTEGAGGLFDFNATLPLMAIQFILLSVVLTFVFYKPVSKVIDDREEYINGNLTTASEKLIKADELYSQYDEQLKTARVSAQAIIAQSEKEANDIATTEVKTCLARTQIILNRKEARLADRIYTALDNIESLRDRFGKLIEQKLLGDALLPDGRFSPTPLVFSLPALRGGSYYGNQNLRRSIGVVRGSDLVSYKVNSAFKRLDDN